MREDQIPTVTSIPLIATRDSIRATAISENQSEFETAIARPSATSLPAFTPYPTPQAIDSPTGIYSDCETARLVARMENCWLGRQGDLYFIVHAGSLISDERQGVVSLFVMNAHQQIVEPLEFFNTPTRSGSIHVIDEDFPRVVLGSTDNEQYIFNVIEKEYE